MKKKYLIIALAVLLTVSAYGIITLTHSPLNQSADRIEIKDGNTGQTYSIDGEQIVSSLKELSEIDVKISGISIWSSGYTYKITFIKKGNSKEIYVQTPTQIKSGVFEYASRTDVIQIILSLIKE